MKGLLTILVMLVGVSAFADRNPHATLGMWHNDDADLTVYTDRSATIEEGCGSYVIAAHEWNTDGVEMTATHSGLPGRPVTQTKMSAKLVAGQIDLTINGVVSTFEEGKGPDRAHCG